jgi:hypothetical protein
MAARVMQELDRVQVVIVMVSSVRLDGRILQRRLIDTEERQAGRIEALLGNCSSRVANPKRI